MEQKIAHYIQENRLLSKRDRVVIALSGGADSVALLRLLLNLGYNCCAVHCNFHLRDEESLRDERFVQSLCQQLQVKLTTAHFQTKVYAQERGISIEMAAREERYAFFEKVRQEEGAQAIAVAHHRDDSAETLLLNLIRGTGIRGLRGIQPKNGYIIRPLLRVGRADILSYLSSLSQDYVTDSTNLLPHYTRNKIRLKIIPLLEELNPSIKEGLAKSAERLAEAEKVYRYAISEAIARVKKGELIDIEKLMQEPSPSSLLHEILFPLGFNSAQIEEILRGAWGRSGLTFQSSTTQLRKEGNLFHLSATGQVARETFLLHKQEKEIDFSDGQFSLHLAPFEGKVERQPHKASLDADKLHFPLTLRRAKEGDRFYPWGMRGSKLISDYLTDLKRPLRERERQWVVEDDEGNIVWLMGERVSQNHGVEDKTTQLCLLEWRKKRTE